MSVLAHEIETVRGAQPQQVGGTVASLRGLTLLVDDLPLPVGAVVRFQARGGAPPTMGEVIGFDGRRAIVMPLASTGGVRAGDRVVGEASAATIPMSAYALGRVIDALGRPIDDKGPIPEMRPVPLHPPPLAPLRRTRIREPISTGVRALDAMLTAGRGQRLGVFAGPGVGKSTLLGSIARFTEAQVNVVALIGERGREVRDFVDGALGPEGLERSVVVVATGDESPLMRIRCFSAACAAAEFFRDRGADVMLMVDSVTRFAQAQRQVGLAVGEPPATKGYTPSVFALLPQLLERAGSVDAGGSITGFYTVLVEGDDMTEPIADAVRGVLDGHVVLSRRIARRGHFPAIDVLDSVSRLADEVCEDGHVAARRQVIRLLAARAEIEDLRQIGAYAKGSNPVADAAVALEDRIDALLRQGPAERDTLDRARSMLCEIALESGEMLGGAS